MKSFLSYIAFSFIYPHYATHMFSKSRLHKFVKKSSQKKKKYMYIVLCSGTWILFTLFDLGCWVNSSKISQQLLPQILKAILTIFYLHNLFWMSQLSIFLSVLCYFLLLSDMLFKFSDLSMKCFENHWCASHFVFLNK